MQYNPLTTGRSGVAAPRQAPQKQGDTYQTLPATSKPNPNRLPTLFAITAKKKQTP
jgi:hypothetical protein